MGENTASIGKVPIGNPSESLATAYPVPLATLSSIDNFACSESKVAICNSGFTTSKSDDAIKSPAQTLPEPDTSNLSLPDLSTSDRNLTFFTFKRISATSSLTSGIVAYS